MARQTLQPDTTRQASAQAGALPVSGQIWNNLCGLARSKTLWGVLLLAVLWGYGYAMNTPAVDMDDLAIATYQQGGEFLRQGRITVWLLQALTGIMTYQRFWPELFFALSLVLAGILLAAVLYTAARRQAKQPGAQLLAAGEAFPHPAGELIVTPHPGEMARLTGLSAAQINADREETARTYAQKWNAVVVLKGSRTVVAAPDGRACVNPTGNPGLARGGSGDVLSGMTAALLACGLPAFEAAACAVYLHGAAADRAAAVLGEYGMLPHDILPQLGRIFAEHQR